MSRNNIFKLFACCFIVKGVKRAAIYDLQRGLFTTIPISLANILISYKNVSYGNLKSQFSLGDVKIIDSYFNFLLKNEFGFWCNSKSEAGRFPEMKMTWDIPFKISNAIVDFDSDEHYNLDNAIENLIKLGVPNIQFRFYSPFTLNFLIKLMSHFEASRVKSIEILTQYIIDFGRLDDDIKNFCKKFIRLNKMVIFDSPESKSISLFNGLTKIQMTKQKMLTDSCCGNIRTHLFRINQNMFLESQKFNSCLNKKMGIDKYGNVKNCPSMKQSYGKISNVELLKIIESDSFKSFWHLNKDEISICKDCEFRYMCIDCRAYLKDENTYDSKPLKCSYDPYACEWKVEKEYKCS